MISTRFHSSHSKTTSNHHFISFVFSSQLNVKNSRRFSLSPNLYAIVKHFNSRVGGLLHYWFSSVSFQLRKSSPMEWGCGKVFFFRLRIAQNKYESFLIFHFTRLQFGKCSSFAKKKAFTTCGWRAFLSFFFIKNTSQTFYDGKKIWNFSIHRRLSNPFGTWEYSAWK